MVLCFINGKGFKVFLDGGDMAQNLNVVQAKYALVEELFGKVDGIYSSSDELEVLYAWAHSVRMYLGVMQHIQEVLNRNAVHRSHLDDCYDMLDDLQKALVGEFRTAMGFVNRRKRYHERLSEACAAV